MTCLFHIVTTTQPINHTSSSSSITNHLNQSIDSFHNHHSSPTHANIHSTTDVRFSRASSDTDLSRDSYSNSEATAPHESLFIDEVYML